MDKKNSFNEKKKQLINKCAAQGFRIAVALGIVLVIIHALDIKFFEGDWGLIFTILVSSSYVLIKEAYFDCSVDKKDRKPTFFICMAVTVILIICMIIWICDLIKNGNDSSLYVIFGKDGVTNVFVITVICMVTIFCEGVICIINDRKNNFTDNDFFDE